MEDGVNGVPTLLVQEHVEVEYSGEQELVQIHDPKVEEKIVEESHKDLLGSAKKSLVQLAPQNTEIFSARNLVQILLHTTGEEKIPVHCFAEEDISFMLRV